MSPDLPGAQLGVSFVSLVDVTGSSFIRGTAALGRQGLHQTPNSHPKSPPHWENPHPKDTAAPEEWVGHGWG